MAEQDLQRALQESEALRMREMDRAARSRDTIVALRERLRAARATMEQLQETVQRLETDRLLEQFEATTHARGVMEGIRLTLEAVYGRRDA